MGNRAVITTACADASKSKDIGVYLHWNGGRDSVEAFLAYCKLKEHRPPDQDSYGWARFCQVVGNYFGGTTSIGVDVCSRLDCDNWDNGVYIISDWEIVGRQYNKGYEQRNYDLREMLIEINNGQPKEEQLEQSVIDEYCDKLQDANIEETPSKPSLAATLKAGAEKSEAEFGEDGIPPKSAEQEL